MKEILIIFEWVAGLLVLFVGSPSMYPIGMTNLGLAIALFYLENKETPQDEI